MCIGLLTALLTLDRIPVDRWKTVDEGVRLVDCTDFDGIGFMQKGRFVAYSADGKVVSSIQPPEDAVPLWFSKADGLTFGSDDPVKLLPAKGEAEGVGYPHQAGYYSQAGRLFIRTASGLIQADSNKTAAFPEFEESSLLGISRDGNQIAFIYPNYARKRWELRLSYLKEKSWEAVKDNLELRVPDVTTLCPKERYTPDAPFFDDDHILFFAEEFGWPNEQKLKVLESQVRDLSPLLVRFSKKNPNNTFYLATCNVRTGNCALVAKFTEWSPGEFGSSRPGLVRVSQSLKWAFVVVGKTILRIPTASLPKS